MRTKHTDWNDRRREYFLEKLFGMGNVVLIVNTLRFMKKFKLWRDFEDGGVTLFLERFMRYGDQLGANGNESYEDCPYEKRWVFRMETMLYLIKHHRDLLVLGNGYEAVIHYLMMKSMDKGMAELAVEFRKLGAAMKTDLTTYSEWNRFISTHVAGFWYNWLWLSWRAPGGGQPGTTREELESRLESRLAVYALGNVRETEKLQDLADLVEPHQYTTVEYSIQQKRQFLELLLKVDAVRKSIRTEAEEWLREHADE